MAYIEGAHEVRPGDPVELYIDGKQLEGAVIRRLTRMELVVEGAEGVSIGLSLQTTNEAIWERGRRQLEEHVLR
jgi:hypothetical protein